MFIAFYRWKLKRGKERQFRTAWTKVTLAIRKDCGSLGSRLHKAEDGTWAAYAQWPSKKLWKACRTLDAKTDIARRKMRAAVKQRFPSLYLTVRDDYLTRER